jgi:hypothetical protein
MLDPRALYRGGFAGSIPPWRYPLCGRSTKGCKWPICAVDAKDSAITELEFAGLTEPKPVQQKGDQLGAKGQMDAR